MIGPDTPVWVDYFNGRRTPETDLFDRLVGIERFIVGDLILTEVLQGFRTQADFERVRRYLEMFDFRPMVGRDVAIAAATNYRPLRSMGLTVRRTVDVLIATFCLIENHSLLHADRDFNPFERHLGLSVVRS